MQIKRRIYLIIVASIILVSYGIVLSYADGGQYEKIYQYNQDSSRK
jgi:hypothetical protein